MRVSCKHQPNDPAMHLFAFRLIWCMCVFLLDVKTEFEQKIAELNRTGNQAAFSE